MNLEDFERQTLPHLDATYRMAMVLAQDPLEAHDLVQETFRRAMGRADRIAQHETGIKVALLRILRSQYEMKAECGRFDQVDLQEHVALLDFSSVDSGDDLVKYVIEQLPARYRSVLLLWSVERLTYAEIAEIEDVAANTVERWLHEAREVLCDLADDEVPIGLARVGHCAATAEITSASSNGVLR